MPQSSTYDVVVVAYKSRRPLTAFLEHLGTTAPVLVVNNSTELDDLADLERLYANVEVVDSGGNVGFSAGANFGATQSSAEHLIFMNPDTLPSEDELIRMVEVLEESPSVASCGAAGIGTAGGGAQPTLLRTMAHSLGLHKVFPMIGIYYYPQHARRVTAGWISGSCLAVRRADFESVGGFDESYFVFMSDFELGLKLAAAGRTQMLLGDVTVEHIDGGSSDLPSEWTWQQRGKGWAQFLRLTMPQTRATLIAGVLVAGYWMRFVIYTALRRPVRAQEVATYARSFAQEWRNGGGRQR